MLSGRAPGVTILGRVMTISSISPTINILSLQSGSLQPNSQSGQSSGTTPANAFDQLLTDVGSMLDESGTGSSQSSQATDPNSTNSIYNTILADLNNITSSLGGSGNSQSGSNSSSTNPLSALVPFFSNLFQEMDTGSLSSTAASGQTSADPSTDISQLTQPTQTPHHHHHHHSGDTTNSAASTTSTDTSTTASAYTSDGSASSTSSDSNTSNILSVLLDISA